MNEALGLEEIATLDKERRVDFQQLTEAVKIIRTHLGGEMKEQEREVSLNNYDFEDQKASISLRVIPRKFFGPKTYLLTPHAQFTGLKVGDIDLIGSERFNPRGGTFLVPLGNENLSLLKAPLRLLSSKTPLGTDYFQVIGAYLGKVYPVGEFEDLVGWYVEIPFPFSLETLSVIIHELRHISDKEAEPEDVQLKLLGSQLIEGEIDKTNEVKEIIRRINTIRAGQENRIQMETLKVMLQLGGKWQLPGYKERLKRLLVLEWQYREKMGIL